MTTHDLFQGEVLDGVHLALPLEGATVILGEGIGAGQVWAEGPPPIVVVLCGLWLAVALRSMRQNSQKSLGHVW